MIYTEATNKAIKLMYQAHMKQYDWGGMPYVFHPYHLAEQMNTEERCCVALLHDVVEDTEVTMDELEREFPGSVVEAVRLLTHDSNSDYYDYVKCVCNNEDAAFVKLADLIHNMSESRLVGADITDDEKNRWFVKYLKAVKLVSEFLNSRNFTPESISGRQLSIILNHIELPERSIKMDEDMTDCFNRLKEYIKR